MGIHAVFTIPGQSYSEMTSVLRSASRGCSRDCTCVVSGLTPKQGESESPGFKVQPTQAGCLSYVEQATRLFLQEFGDNFVSNLEKPFTCGSGIS
jgi:hypothetical protein